MVGVLHTGSGENAVEGKLPGVLWHKCRQFGFGHCGHRDLELHAAAESQRFGGLALLLLGEQHGVDVREDSALGHGDSTEELVELLVVPHGELDMAWHDPGPLVILGGIPGKLQQLGGEVLEDGGHVDGGAGTNPLGESALAKIPGHTADGELESGLGGS